MLESPIYKVYDKSVVEERELAEKIFQVFRDNHCKNNQGVVWMVLYDKVVQQLNPKEQELFYRVYMGLQALGYITVDSDSNFIRLTQKGYDYIYEDEKVKALSNIPWIIPDYSEDQDWDKVCKKFIKVGIDGDNFHIPGPAFFSIVSDLTDKVPVSYSKYIEERIDREQLTSRKEYYVDLINLIDKWLKKYELYVRCQEFIESQVLSKFSDEYDIDTTEDKEDKLPFEEEQATILQDGESKKQVDDTQEDINTQKSEHPKVFISYSWDNEEHKEWIRKFADALINNGIDIILDQYEVRKGALLDDFMEQSVRDSERVLCVLTPNYKKKTERLEGGVGEEYSIIKGELYQQLKSYKYIPILRAGKIEAAAPILLYRRDYVDMSVDTLFNNKVEEVLRELYNEPKYKKPKLGHKPDFNNMNSSKDAQGYKLIWPK